ncbi:hypothetical protein NLX83_30955 [Allokutzneria sp. A3M-2-11 16]|uniref:hypothetical protein n=1 Tax=Allokutzneria sp. A3M-2-11 16 TaxID=2962043 RepID=UPI0020B7DD10|nr:hypothetical protein [Allokutzneria sp. A3M-2-11 16]MCP3803700.1 hypothetical protein [Allokutzneria sp. A3M-2-11 16]
MITWNRAQWRNHFAEILLSGDSAEIEAATAAALAAAARGADPASAKREGKAAAKRHRERPATTALAWREQLATRLFALPPRWGWRAAPLATRPAAPISPAPPAPRPIWAEPPRPDTSALHGARAKAASRLRWQVAFTVLAVVAFFAFQTRIEREVRALGRETREVYEVGLIIVAILLGLSVLGALSGLRRAQRDLRAFEQPYLAFRAEERRRHEAAHREWEQAVRAHAAAAEAARWQAAQAAAGPQWFPVRPAGDPTRVDVLGGDPRRHGWASLLVTVGASVLAAGERITVLDMTGHDVGGGLAGVAQARGYPTHRVDLDDDGAEVELLAGIDRRDIPECLAHAIAGRSDRDDPKQERALLTEVLTRVVAVLAPPLTFARLAAGARVLRQGSGEDALRPEEVSALAGQIGDIDQNEWTARQLRFLAARLDLLGALAPGTRYPCPLWTPRAVSVVATDGGRGDRKELVDRLLVELAIRALDSSALGGFLVVAGADHLGAHVLTTLSDHARRAGVRLMLMIDQPRGEVERTVGTGGAVCVMKMYNHRDATMAAEFVGRGHRFVVNQITRQTGKTFSDGGGDSFGANTNQGTSTERKRRNGKSLSDSRGHAWTGTRNWSVADNLSTSTSESRVYEFIVEPQELLGMPETAFLLVDNSGAGRRVTVVDANPGISLLPRVSTAVIE